MLDGPDVRAGSIPAEQPLRQVGRGHWNPPAAAWRWRCAFPAKLPACCAARSQRDCLEARHHDHACKSAPGPRELDAKMPSWRFATRIDRSLRNLPNPQEERVSGSQKTPAWWHSSHRCLQRRAGSCMRVHAARARITRAAWRHSVPAAGAMCPYRARQRKRSASTSQNASTASTALSYAYSSVSPAEKQPGRAGTATPNAVVSEPGSIAIKNFIPIPASPNQRRVSPWPHWRPAALPSSCLMHVLRAA